MNNTIVLKKELLLNKVFDYAERFKLYVLLLLMASEQPPSPQTVPTPRAQVVTSINKLSIHSSLTPKQVRNALRALQKSGLIEVVATHRCTMIYLRHLS